MWKTKFGTCIYVSPSGYKVYQNLLYRWLTLGSNALQTVINRHNPKKPGLYYLPALTLMARKHPGTSCLLGLGGAGVAHMLGSVIPEQTLIAVDISDEVIQIAQQFFMVDLIQGLTIFKQNATEYVRENNDKFTHLLIDLYDANNFPAECKNDNFFLNCKNRLEKDGFIAVNLANFKEQWPIFQLIKKQFEHTITIPMQKSANMVIIASPIENKELFINKIRETGEIKKIEWMDNWGCVGSY